MADPDHNPTPEALAAMALWGTEYGQQRRGTQDWYETLTIERKRTARDMAQRIIHAGEKLGAPFSRIISAQGGQSQ